MIQKDLKNARILIVDDLQTNIDILTELLVLVGRMIMKYVFVRELFLKYLMNKVMDYQIKINKLKLGIIKCQHN